MSKKKNPRPTDSELAILNVLWQRGPSMVRQVQDALIAKKRIGYTTVLKLLQIMHEKGLVTRDESRRPHVYQPRLPAEKTRRQLVGDFMEKVFDGSPGKLIMQALDAKRVSAEDLKRIRTLLDEYERKKS